MSENCEWNTHDNFEGSKVIFELGKIKDAVINFIKSNEHIVNFCERNKLNINEIDYIEISNQTFYDSEAPEEGIESKFNITIKRIKFYGSTTSFTIKKSYTERDINYVLSIGFDEEYPSYVLDEKYIKEFYYSIRNKSDLFEEYIKEFLTDLYDS